MLRPTADVELSDCHAGKGQIKTMFCLPAAAQVSTCQQLTARVS